MNMGHWLIMGPGKSLVYHFRLQFLWAHKISCAERSCNISEHNYRRLNLHFSWVYLDNAAATESRIMVLRGPGHFHETGKSSSCEVFDCLASGHSHALMRWCEDMCGAYGIYRFLTYLPNGPTNTLKPKTLILCDVEECWAFPYVKIGKLANFHFMFFW